MNRFYLFLALALVSYSQEIHAQNDCGLSIQAPPAGYDSFYAKYAVANGIPVIGSSNVSDSAFCIAWDIVYNMTITLPQGAVDSMVNRGARLAIMSTTEVTTDIPEHSNLYTLYPGTNWDAFRGIGGTVDIPVTSCAEENLLCLGNDIYLGENITIHEFAHGIHNLGLALHVPDFEEILFGAYLTATSNGLWDSTYAGTNMTEYFAEGVQTWFDANLQATPPNGIHNHVNTRAELQTYDSLLYKLIEQYFNTQWRPTCIPGDVITEPTAVDLTISGGMRVFPNPTQDAVIISLQANVPFSYSLFDLYGKELLNGRLKNDRIELNSIPAGVYLLRLLGEKAEYSQKIVKY